MADNVSLPASGVTVATDDVGGVHFPLSKLVLGALDANNGPVAKGNPLPVMNVTSNTPTLAGVTASASSTSIAAANSNRRGLLLHNNSTATLYLKYGATASIASGGYSVSIPPYGYWEMPTPTYQGALDGIWDAANGYVNVTELT